MTAERKKLLVLTSTLPRWEGDTEPRFVEYLGYELARHFEVVILAPRCPNAARRETYTQDGQSITVHRFRYFIPAFESLAYEGGILSRLRRNPLRVLLVPLFLLAQLISVAKLHREHRFDAIHAHWIIPQGLVAACFALLNRKAPPVLVTSHGGDLFALQGALLVGLKRWVLARATRTTVVSRAMRDYAVELGCDTSKIFVQSMGVDLCRTFTPGDPAQERKGIIFVGRLVEKKGIGYLIEAMGPLVRRFPDLQLTIIGDGPLRQSLTTAVRDTHLDTNIRFLGSLPNVQLPQYLRQSKIAVMPSVVAESGDQEGLGLVAVEAMGCGCAVVASDLAAVRDAIIDGETGLLADPADPLGLAAKIASLLDDDACRERLAENARRYALEHFDWRHVGDRYAELITGMP